MEDTVLWGPNKGLLVNGKTSTYTFILPTAQMVAGFVYRMTSPTLKQAIMVGEHGVLTIINGEGQTWVEVPLRKIRLESDTFSTKLDNKAPMYYAQKRLYEIRGWGGKIEFFDFPITGWGANDMPITSKRKWSEFPDKVQLFVGVTCRPIGNPSGRGL